MLSARSARSFLLRSHGDEQRWRRGEEKTGNQRSELDDLTEQVAKTVQGGSVSIYERGERGLEFRWRCARACASEEASARTNKRASDAGNIARRYRYARNNKSKPPRLSRERSSEINPARTRVVRLMVKRGFLMHRHSRRARAPRNRSRYYYVSMRNEIFVTERFVRGGCKLIFVIRTRAKELPNVLERINNLLLRTLQRSCMG